MRSSLFQFEFFRLKNMYGDYFKLKLINKKGIKMKNQIVWVDIPVNNLDRAISFYAQVLDGKVTKENGHAGVIFGLLPHEEGNVSACLFTTSDNAPSQNGPLVYLNAEGRLDKAMDSVKSQGGTILEEIHPIGKFGFRVVIIDSEGNRIALHSFTR